VNIRGQQKLFGQLTEAVEQLCSVTQDIRYSGKMIQFRMLNPIEHIDSIITMSGAGI